MQRGEGSTPKSQHLTPYPTPFPFSSTNLSNRAIWIEFGNSTGLALCLGKNTLEQRLNAFDGLNDLNRLNGWSFVSSLNLEPGTLNCLKVLNGWNDLNDSLRHRPRFRKD